MKWSPGDTRSFWPLFLPASSLTTSPRTRSFTLSRNSRTMPRSTSASSSEVRTSDSASAMFASSSVATPRKRSRALRKPRVRVSSIARQASRRRLNCAASLS